MKKIVKIEQFLVKIEKYLKFMLQKLGVGELIFIQEKIYFLFYQRIIQKMKRLDLLKKA